MLYNFNRLCIANTLAYDVDFDGDVDIMDATEYQRVLAGIIENNSSISHITNFDTLAATKIQRRLAGYDADKINYAQSVLDVMISTQERLNIESEEFSFGAWKLNNLYSSHRVAGRC